MSQCASHDCIPCNLVMIDPTSYATSHCTFYNGRSTRTTVTMVGCHHQWQSTKIEFRNLSRPFDRQIRNVRLRNPEWVGWFIAIRVGQRPFAMQRCCFRSASSDICEKSVHLVAVDVHAWVGAMIFLTMIAKLADDALESVRWMIGNCVKTLCEYEGCADRICMTPTRVNVCCSNE